MECFFGYHDVIITVVARSNLKYYILSALLSLKLLIYYLYKCHREHSGYYTPVIYQIYQASTIMNTSKYWTEDTLFIKYSHFVWSPQVFECIGFFQIIIQNMHVVVQNWMYMFVYRLSMFCKPCNSTRQGTNYQSRAFKIKVEDLN